MANIALVPASELASLERWTDVTRQLPPGSVLVVAQYDNLRLQAVGREIDHALRQRGRRARLVNLPKQLPFSTGVVRLAGGL